jgi:chemotaxis protein methyltransferase CheR
MDAVSPPNAAFDIVRKIAYEDAAIVLDNSKQSMMSARLTPVAKDRGFPTLMALLVALDRAPRGPLRVPVVHALLTHETSFFRDQKPFEVLRDKIIPELMKARKDLRKLTIWSAACSTGQEPYTLAMTIASAFPELLRWDLTLIATDFSEDALSKARAGVYSKFEVGRGLTDPAFSRYLSADGNDVRIRDEVKKVVDFRRLNLVGPWLNLPRFDIVLIRNVLIYFDQPSKQKVLTNVRRQMANDGWMALGSSESLVFLDVPFRNEVVDKSSWYRPT